MEYIQCQHCKKKYAVSERLRAAVGKQIRCRHCRQPFEIEIRDDAGLPGTQPNGAGGLRYAGAAADRPLVPSDGRPDERQADRAEHHPPHAQPLDKGDDPSAAGDAASETADEGPASAMPAVDRDVRVSEAATDRPDADAVPGEEADSGGADRRIPEVEGKKRLNLQALISSLLGFILIGLSAAGYFYLYQPQREPAGEPAIIPQQLVNPMQGPQPAGVQQPGTAGAEPEVAHEQPERAKSLLDGPDHPSQVCRDVAADYWLRTRMLVTTKLATDAYMQLLNMNLEQADEIRKLCRERLLLGRLASAAKAGRVPPWISREIRSRQDGRLPQPAADQ